MDTLRPRFKHFLKRSFIEGTWISKSTILTAATIGFPAHFGFYFLFKYGFHLPYENFYIRITAAALCLIASFHPLIKKSSVGKFFPFFWHVMLIFVLPFIFTLYLLKNNFHELWLYWEIFMIFILIIHVPNWFMFLVDLGLGVAGAVAFFAATESFQMLTPHFNMTLYGIVIAFSITAGVAFHESNKRLLLDTEEKIRRAMSSLAGSIAHEMRNPLSQIKYSLDSISRDLPSPVANHSAPVLSPQKLDDLYQHVTVGELAIQRGLQVISMILGEMKSKSIDATTFVYLHAGKTTQKAIAEYSYETEQEHDKVRVHVINDFTFKGGETLYLFILFNLIKNALYYFKQHPAATITITIDRPNIIVRDTGPGISSTQLTQLFEPFKTAGKSEGTGLGLSYCKRAMSAFGGNIVCDSVLGKYTQFTLSFPEIPPTEIAANQQAILQKAQSIFKDKRILVVDDDTILRMTTVKMLENLGAHIDEAANGVLALSRFNHASYDLIVLDLNMPGLDGYCVAEKIRSSRHTGYQLVPIVAYSNEPAYMAQAKTKKVGINSFISKPFAQLELIEILANILEEASQHTKAKITSSLAGKTILIAEDNEYNRMTIKNYLQAWDIKVIEAEHGQAALEKLQNHSSIDAILMDISMPVMDGLEATRAIRNQQSIHQNVPIIALTGYSDDVHIQSTSEAGMNDFLVKPVDSMLLRQKLDLHFLKKPALKNKEAVSPVPAEKPAPDETRFKPRRLAEMDLETIENLPLLNIERLEEYQRIGLLNELPAYAGQANLLLEKLKSSIARKNFEEMHKVMHSFLGFSGNAGALALYHYIRHLYPPIVQGQWPDEKDWLEKIEALSGQTDRALQDYYTQHGIKVPSDSI